MRGNLGIGTAAENVAERLQMRLERRVVLDDPVVNDDDLAIAADMRVRVDVGGLTMRRPARVSDAQRSDDRMPFQQPSQFLHSAGFLANRNLAAVDHGDPRAVVAAIFEPPQTFQQNLGSGTKADITNDTAHAERAPSRNGTIADDDENGRPTRWEGIQ